MKPRRFFATAFAVIVLASCTAATPEYDIIIRGGTVYDGLGGNPFVGDVAIDGDRIAAIGDLDGASAHQELKLCTPQIRLRRRRSRKNV